MKVFVGLISRQPPLMFVVGKVKEQKDNELTLEKAVGFTIAVAQLAASPDSPVVPPEMGQFALIVIPHIFRINEAKVNKQEYLEYTIFKLSDLDVLNEFNVPSLEEKSDAPDFIMNHLEQLAQNYPTILKHYEDILEQDRRFYEQAKQLLKSRLIIANNLPKNFPVNPFEPLGKPQTTLQNDNNKQGGGGLIIDLDKPLG